MTHDDRDTDRPPATDPPESAPDAIGDLCDAVDDMAEIVEELSGSVDGLRDAIRDGDSETGARLTAIEEALRGLSADIRTAILGTNDRLRRVEKIVKAFVEDEPSGPNGSTQ